MKQHFFAIKLSERGRNSLGIPYQYRIWCSACQNYHGESIKLSGDFRQEAEELIKLQAEVERKLRALSERVFNKGDV